MSDITNILGIMLEILNNFPWTRLVVRTIRTIKRYFCIWTIIPPLGGGRYRDFQEAGNFLLPSIERLQIFFLHSLCRYFFLKFLRFPITGLASVDNFFSDAPLGQTIYFSNFSHADNFFSQSRYLPGKNNGPSLIYKGHGRKHMPAILSTTWRPLFLLLLYLPSFSQCVINVSNVLDYAYSPLICSLRVKRMFVPPGYSWGIYLGPTGIDICILFQILSCISSLVTNRKI